MRSLSPWVGMKVSEALKLLGAKVKREANVLVIDAASAGSGELPENLSRRMRASNLIMGPLLGRFKDARILVGLVVPFRHA